MFLQPQKNQEVFMTRGTIPNRRQQTQTVAAAPLTPKKKLIVLDTSVFFHNPRSMFQFKEHDVFLTGVVHAQIDHKKEGHTDLARNAREVRRLLDEIFKGDPTLMRSGASLQEASGGSATGKLFFEMDEFSFKLPNHLLYSVSDCRIIEVACALSKSEQWGQYQVVLVSKDGGMRFAALRMAEKAGIQVQDYLSDKVLLKDSDVLPVGFYALPPDFWETHEILDPGKRDTYDLFRVRGPLCGRYVINEGVYLKDGSLCARVRGGSTDEMLLQRITDYTRKNTVCGMRARNIGQSFALNNLMDPSVHLVTLLGSAGAGKTICATAAGFELVHGRHADDPERMSEIVAVRKLDPVGGEQLGFFPGSPEEKTAPWYMSISDAKDALVRNAKKFSSSWTEPQIEHCYAEIQILAMGMVAGRTLSHRYMLIEEAQNLTPLQMKMLLTRAGEGTKVVVCGNLEQIDNPYLDEKSSGLARLVMRMRDHKHVAHVILQESVRSPLTALAVERL